MKSQKGIIMADLVTLAEYKAFAGISSTNQDTEIKSLIPKISALVKTYCNRTFVDYFNDSKTEVFTGGNPYFLLSEFPINSVDSVEWSQDYGKTYTNLVEFTDYTLDLEWDRIAVINNTEFPKYTNGYRVTYTGGYEVIPQDLKLAVLDLLEYYLKSDMAIKSQRERGANTVQVEYVTTTNLPSHIRRVLDMYRGSL
jgi:hypothetical protein